MLRKRLLGVAMFLAASAIAAPSVAQRQDTVAAQALFDEAKQLMANKRFDEACPKLEESNRLDPGVGTLLRMLYPNRLCCGGGLQHDDEGLYLVMWRRRADHLQRRLLLCWHLRTWDGVKRLRHRGRRVHRLRCVAQRASVR
jgi:hypothetical protein